MAAILKILNIKHSFNLTSDMKKKIPNYANVFHGDDIIDDITGWPQSFPLYSCLGEIGSGSKLQGQCLVNKYKYRNRHARLYMPKDDINEYHFSRLQVKCQRHRQTWMPFGGLIGWLFNWKCKFSYIISSNIVNYLKYNYLCDGDGINNVMLRLWTFSVGLRHELIITPQWNSCIYLFIHAITSTAVLLNRRWS